MSSFFTKPASGKRKRAPTTAPSRPSKRRERTDSDEELTSGSEDDDDNAPTAAEPYESESSSGDEDEDAAGKRTRYAERYLENTKREILAHGFDAKDIDNELLAERMGERLAEDSAESKGKIYRFIADDFDWAGAAHTQFRKDTQTLTGVAVCGKNVYTVSKDMVLIKWELPEEADEEGKPQGQQRRKPKCVKFTKGNGKKSGDRDYLHHTAEILCVAASGDGKFVATGGADWRLIIWDAETLEPLRVFSQNSHRDSVTSLAFRRGTNQLFSAGKDRTVKIWSLDELAYVETLFGHQDEVVDVAALNEEKCVTVGARDRTARFWRVVEESQLVFRGGGSSASSKKKNQKNSGFVSGVDNEERDFHECCIDRVAMLDAETFITGSDNGSLSLWSLQKKKAVFTLPLAHGLDPPPNPEDVSAEADPHSDPSVPRFPLPRWITALASLPFSNIFVTGSWDGQIRAWKVSEDKRRIEPLGAIGCVEKPVVREEEMMYMDEAALQLLNEVPDAAKTLRGVVNDLAIYERGERGRDGLGIVAVVGKEHRLGRWIDKAGKNYAMLFTVPKKSGDAAAAITNGHAEEGDE